MGTIAATWQTRDGRSVRIRDMGDTHLVNTIKYLRRNRQNIVDGNYIAALSYSENAPDGAAMAAEQGAEWLMDFADDEEQLESCVPQYRALCDEAKRRKLNV